MWERDGLRLRVMAPTATVDDPLPAEFGWVSAIARRTPTGPSVAGSATADGLDVLCVWAGGTLTAGRWRVQVRAGETEASARTIYDGTVTMLQTLTVP